FFSSRRRHTRWPRDWSSACALPICKIYLCIWSAPLARPLIPDQDQHWQIAQHLKWYPAQLVIDLAQRAAQGSQATNGHLVHDPRSEERRVGKECRTRSHAQNENKEG